MGTGDFVSICVPLDDYSCSPLYLLIQPAALNKYMNFEGRQLEQLSLHSLTKCLTHTIFTSLEILLSHETLVSGSGSAHVPLSRLPLLPMEAQRNLDLLPLFSITQNFPRSIVFDLHSDYLPFLIPCLKYLGH